MGYYIQTDKPFGKVDYLIANHGAVKLNAAPNWADVDHEKQAIVCVVRNRGFEAAGYCYSRSELEEFSDVGDFRPKTWLVMDKAVVKKLTNFSS